MSKADELLRELVACNDLKNSIKRMRNAGYAMLGWRHPKCQELTAARKEYEERRPLAWKAARAYLNEKPHEPPADISGVGTGEYTGCLAQVGKPVAALASPPHAAAEPERPVAWMYQAELGRDERDALQAEVVALREALRKYAITAKIRPPCYVCELCENYWTPGQPERHFAGCLAEKDKGG